jgi:opacity protein-like surface antigen
MFSPKSSIYLLFTAAVALTSIDSAQARDISALKMSFSDRKVSASSDRKSSKPQPKKSVAQNVQRENRQTGWYWGTVRGANFPNMAVTSSEKSSSGATSPNIAATDSNKTTINWSGNNALGSLIDLSNINAFAGYKSSNFRLEGEVTYATNSMTKNASQPASGGSKDCNATTFAAILNGYYDIETGSQIKPFVGAGVGFASTNLKDSQNKDWGSASGLIYQLKAGVGYPLSDRQDIYLQYKYVNAPATYVIDGKQTSTDFNYGSIEFGTKFNF